MSELLQKIENPDFFKENRLDAHSDHLFFDSLESLESNTSTLLHSLNGIWKFKWSKNLQDRPTSFYEENYDLSSFGEIPVPSHIELNGYDQIQYINTMYPWDGMCNLRPPHTDKEYNPVGSYVTFFDLPNNFTDKEVCISFKGVEQGFRLFLNGTYIGYAEDTFTPSDFNLTPYIKPAGNRLCVEVYKRTSASWLEDQDFFRFSGIFRDVVLYAKPKHHVEDLWVLPTLSDDLLTGSLQIKIKMNAIPHVKAILLDINKNIVIEDTLELSYTEKEMLEPAENRYTYYESQVFSIANPTLWDIKKPHLYTLILTSYDENGNLQEAVSQPLGFRHFIIKDSVMYLNGKRLIINGVNRHEWNPRTGRCISKEDMITDITTIKSNNITAVRTSHYPNQTFWYELCDQNGIIVMDESNLESHGSWQKMGAIEPSWNVPGSLPEWHNAIIDRAVSMFERDKNHPSILWWSCGNESYAGEVILAMSNYFRRKDNSRFVHYEGCFYTDEFSDCTDVYSRMYPTPTEIREFLTAGYSKPYVLCEYMHDMGNSLGGMESYINLLDEFPSYQGGFIWDYKDQALFYMKDGKEVLGYGGDFGERPTDYNFSGNGIVFADGTEKPAMQDVKFWYSTPEERSAHLAANAETIQALRSEVSTETSETFEIIRGDVNLGIKGKNFHHLFSFQDGGLVSMKFGGKEWLYRAPKPTYWRAPTENDVPNGFLQKSAIWSSVTKYSKHFDVKVNTDLPNEVSITFIFDNLTLTTTEVTYTVYGDGKIKVSTVLHGNDDLPQLPLFGMKFLLNESFKTFDYIGYSGETYPDRFKGGTFGMHQSTTDIANYLVPQENGCHMYSHQVNLVNSNNETLRIIMADTPFHFSVLQNTSEELEHATHREELPNTGRSTLSIFSHMRGVGGIDTWGSDVEEAYHVWAKKDLTLTFFIDTK